MYGFVTPGGGVVVGVGGCNRTLTATVSKKWQKQLVSLWFELNLFKGSIKV